MTSSSTTGAKKVEAQLPQRPVSSSQGLSDVTATYFLGTHRIRTPEETWEWLQPVLPIVGITRVADVTALDVLGFPVYQAVRPASRSLSVSQGKAVTAAGAKVSAAMEGIELWHCERLDPVPQVEVSLREIQYANPIESAHLKWRSDTRLLDAMPLAWLKTRSLTGGRDGWLPRSMVELDLTQRLGFEPQMFHRTSNGLASGNCLPEAQVHALCELIERHGLYLDHRDPSRKKALDPESLRDTYCWDLIERIRATGMKVALWDLTWELGVPCVAADVIANDLPNIWRGSGCHGAPEVAVSRALSEAAQSRLTYISGARDDLTEFGEFLDAEAKFASFVEPSPTCRLEDLPSLATGNLARDLEVLLERLVSHDYSAYAIDLTRPEIGVPVVSAFVPGLNEAPYG